MILKWANFRGDIPHFCVLWAGLGSAPKWVPGAGAIHENCFAPFPFATWMAFFSSTTPKNGSGYTQKNAHTFFAGVKKIKE